MSFLEPAELRYLIISMFALIIITNMIVFSGAASSGNEFDPDKEAMNATNTTSWWTSNFDSSSFFTNDVFDEVIKTLVGGFNYFHSVYAAWDLVITKSGWASAFVTVPTVVIFMMGLSAFLKVMGVLPYT